MIDAAERRLLVTGFGPFPGVPSNPTEALVCSLAAADPDALGASALKAVVLPTEYRRSWEILRRLYAGFEPDVVVHFGLHGKAQAIQVETVARNRIDPGKPDGSADRASTVRLRRSGPDELWSTLPAPPIVAALARAGLAASVSEDAGLYVCNATLYRSLAVAPSSRRVGFIHVPPPSVLSAPELERAARIVLRTALTESGLTSDNRDITFLKRR